MGYQGNCPIAKLERIGWLRIELIGSENDIIIALGSLGFLLDSPQRASAIVIVVCDKQILVIHDFDSLRLTGELNLFTGLLT
jgi:hypothetical protein